MAKNAAHYADPNECREIFTNNAHSSINIFEFADWSPHNYFTKLNFKLKMDKSVPKVVRVVTCVAFAVTILYPFQYLGEAPILLWDESRRAVNALEMLQNGNYLVPHFLGHPDMWG